MMESTDDETVCSFCGMSHLMYAEQRKTEKEIGKRGRRIVQLEGHIETLGLVVPPAEHPMPEDTSKCEETAAYVYRDCSGAHVHLP